AVLDHLRQPGFVWRDVQEASNAPDLAGHVADQVGVVQSEQVWESANVPPALDVRPIGQVLDPALQEVEVEQAHVGIEWGKPDLPGELEIEAHEMVVEA